MLGDWEQSRVWVPECNLLQSQERTVPKAVVESRRTRCLPSPQNADPKLLIPEATCMKSHLRCLRCLRADFIHDSEFKVHGWLDQSLEPGVYCRLHWWGCWERGWSTGIRDIWGHSPPPWLTLRSLCRPPCCVVSLSLVYLGAPSAPGSHLRGYRLGASEGQGNLSRT